MNVSSGEWCACECGVAMGDGVAGVSCVVVCMCVCRCVCVFELRCVLVGWVLARTTHRLQSPTPRIQVRAIRSTITHPSRRQSERPRPMEHRDEAVRQSRRSGEARASVDGWAVRPRCRRAVAIPPMPFAIDTDRGTVMSCVREIDHTRREVDRTDRG